LIANEWTLVLIDALSLLFGAVILFASGTGALAIVLWIGVYALIFGIFLPVLAVRVRGFRHVAAEGGAYYCLRACLRGVVSHRPCSERAFGVFNAPAFGIRRQPLPWTSLGGSWQMIHAENNRFLMSEHPTDTP
jgi:hypothetical protein